MESLLANYGSDEEDGDVSPPGLPEPSLTSTTSVAPAPSWNRQSIFGSLPPPRNAGKQLSLWDDDEEDVSARPIRNSFAGDSGKSRSPPMDRSPELKNEANGKQEIGTFSAFALRPSRPDPAALPSDFFSNSSSSSLVGEDSPPSPDFSEKLQGKSVSLFSRLPPPVSSRALSGTLVPPLSSTAPAKKKVVDFRPPINLEALRVPDDDELGRKEKPVKAVKDANRMTEATTVTGLFALLPPPKNNLGAGVGLGGGGAHGGRRTIMETSAVTTSGMAGSHSDHHHHNIEERGSANFEDSLQAPTQRNEVPYHTSYQSRHVENPEELYANSHDFQEGIAPGYPGSRSTLAQGSSADVLAEVMKKERKRGREVAPAMMMEVKQADLTAGANLRQDQLRSTGIAFGPSYQPAASSSKDKPSKLHRRKHQLGALYYDMKQNEMNLMERRSKGQLLKSETQAKYGW